MLFIFTFAQCLVHRCSKQYLLNQFSWMEKKAPHTEGFKYLTVLRSELISFKICKQIYSTRKFKIINLARHF